MTISSSGSAACHEARGRRAGVTLIEILIVIVIISVASTGLTFGFGALSRSQLRSASLRLVAAARYGYHRAASRGSTVRLTLSLADGTVRVEEAQGRVVLARRDARSAAPKREGQAQAGAAIDPWEAAKAHLQQQQTGNEVVASAFQPVATPGMKKSKAATGSALASGVRIRSVWTPHSEEPTESGTESIYFFPGGVAEHAVVQLQDRFKRVFSVEISPLTGRATIHPDAYEPETISDEPEDEQSSTFDDLS